MTEAYSLSGCGGREERVGAGDAARSTVVVFYGAVRLLARQRLLRRAGELNRTSTHHWLQKASAADRPHASVGV